MESCSNSKHLHHRGTKTILLNRQQLVMMESNRSASETTIPRPAMKSDRPDWLPTRRSLLSRLQDWEDHESWQDFFNLYGKLIYSVAIRSGLNDAEAQDVVQETVLSVSQKMPEFRYDPAIGSFRSWLLLITYRRIADHMRKAYRRNRLVTPVRDQTREGETSVLDKTPDPARPVFEAMWQEEWEKNLMDAAINRIKQRVRPRQFQIFECYVLKQWSVSKVARTLKVSVTQVYLAKHRIGKLIQQELKNLERDGGSEMSRTKRSLS